MKTCIRKAIPGDLPVLNQISIESKRYWGYPNEWMERWRSDLSIRRSDIKKHAVYVLELDEAPIGFCSIAENENAYEVLHLWVLPAHIGKGYGKLLLNESITNCIGKEKKVLVEADPNAEAFYKSQGFVSIGQVESYPEGRFLPVMEKKVE